MTDDLLNRLQLISNKYFIGPLQHLVLVLWLLCRLIKAKCVLAKAKPDTETFASTKH